MDVRRQESVIGDAVPFPGRTVAGAAVVTALLIAALSVFSIDISAWQDFDNDVTMLRRSGSVERYYDPSPHGVWLPSDLFVWDSVRSGTLPFWERLQGGGYSTLDTMQEGVLHPARWLTALVPRRSAPSALIVISLAIAFTGMFVLARSSLGHSTAGAVFAAIAFTFSAVLIAFVHFSGAILPLAHIPWLVLFLRRASGGTRATALVLTLASLLLSGHPLLEACAVATAGGVAIADAISRRSWRPVAIYAAASAAALVIASPTLLPPVVSRSDLWTYKTRTAFGVVFVPYSWPDWLAALKAQTIDTYVKGTSYIDKEPFYLYVGIAALILTVAGMISARFNGKTRPLVLLLVIAFLVSVPGPWMTAIAFPPLSFFKPWYLIGSFSFFLACVASAGFEWLAASKGSRRIIGVILATTVAATYLWRAGEVLSPRISRGPEFGPALNFLKRDHDPFRVMSLWGQTLMPNASRLTGIENIRLSGPIFTNRYHAFWQLVDPYVMSHAFPTTRITDKLDSPLIGDFNIRYILQSRLAPAGTLSTNRDERLRDMLLSPWLTRFPVAFRNPWVEIRRNVPFVNPRAHFAHSVVRVASLEAAVDALQADGSLPLRAAVVERGIALADIGSDGDAVVSYPSDRSVLIETRNAKEGLLVLHDSFAEGWTATVDGRAEDVLPVNILSRGVIVPAGTHRIEMSYMPPGFIGGAGFSVAMLLVLFLVHRRGKESA